MRIENLFIVITLFFLNIWIFLPDDLSYATGSKSYYNKKALQYFVNIGQLPNGIRKQIEERGKADVIVTFEASDVRDKASQMRTAEGLRSDNPQIIHEKARLYNIKKDRVLSDISTSDYTVLKDYSNLPVIYIEVNENSLTKLLQTFDVKFIGENNKSFPALSQSLSLVSAPDANNAGATGANTSVAVLDTGVDYTLPAFGSCTSPGSPSSCKVAYAHDFTPSDDGSRDDMGHGTNVSGIVVGVAPDTKILGLDVFRTDGGAYDSDILDALDWVIDNISNYNIKAVNMSLGGDVKYTSPCPFDNLASAISDLKSAGVLTAISSGNDGFKDGMSRPACIPDAISVGAVSDSNLGARGPEYWHGCTDGETCPTLVPCWSNSSTFLDILAPGADTTAAGSTYNGTSQAAPHVAGAIAAVSDATALHADNIRKLLTSSGISVTDDRNSITKQRLEVGPISGCSYNVRILGGSYYSSLQTAYNAAGNGDTIQATKSIIIGGLTASDGKSVTLAGGYDCNFGTRTGYTYVKGNIQNERGSLSMGRIVLMR